MQTVETKIRENSRFTITTLSFYVSRSVVHKIVTEDLNFKKSCSRWIPRQLTAEHKEKELAILLDFLIRYEEERDNMLSRIVTGDEIWVSHITLESKQQCMEWQHTSSTNPNKRCQSATLWQQCSGTGWWSLCHKEQ
ncbi:uncharacterized protein TNCV_1350331 [Trichonephila clavipes]|nr:uncharacterized protein TNCV_1350331 [Trichonephila clavipes]